MHLLSCTDFSALCIRDELGGCNIINMGHAKLQVLYLGQSGAQEQGSCPTACQGAPCSNVICLPCRQGCPGPKACCKLERIRPQDH